MLLWNTVSKKQAVSTPTSLLEFPGIVWWYDFSDSSVLYTDSARLIPVASNGDPIGGVTDKSGAGNHLEQTTTANKFTYATNVQNGLSSASLDGGDLLTTTTSNIDLSAGYSLFYIVNTSATVATQIEFIQSSTGLGARIVQQSTNTIRNLGYYDTTVKFKGRAAQSVHSHSTAYIYNLTYEGGTDFTSWKVWQNGTQVDTTNIANDTFVAPYGSYKYVLGNQVTGNIMSSVCYTPRLSSLEESQVETILNNKWAVY